MPASISREYRIYLALWRKALLSNEPVIVKCSNHSIAISMRQGMYRAIQPFREGTSEDTELRTAAEKFVVYIVKGEDSTAPHFIEIRPRATLSAIEALSDLGLEEDDLLFGDERTVKRSLQKLAKAKPAKKKEQNPFYSRDE